MLVLFSRVSLFFCFNVSFISCFISTFNVWISNTKNTKKKREKNNKNCVESQEDSKIIDNVLEHVDDWTQRTEDSQEHESLVKSDQKDKHHHKFASNDEWSFNSLHTNIDKRNNDVEHIKVILNIIKVTHSISDYLLELVVSWIDQTHQDWNQEESLEVEISVIQNVRNVDVDDKGKHVEAVEGDTDDVVVVGVSVPFKLDQLLNS